MEGQVSRDICKFSLFFFDQNIPLYAKVYLIIYSKLFVTQP